MLAIVHEPTNEQFWQSVFSPRSDSPVSNNHGPNERQPTILQSLGLQARIMLPSLPTETRDPKPQGSKPRCAQSQTPHTKCYVHPTHRSGTLSPKPFFVARLGEFFGVRECCFPASLGEFLPARTDSKVDFPQPLAPTTATFLPCRDRL